MSLTYNIENCESVFLTDESLTSDSSSIFEMMKNDIEENYDGMLRKYTIEYSENCCDTKSIDIPVAYSFDSSLISFSMDSVYGTYILKLNGITGGFISEVELSYNNSYSYNPVQFNKHLDGISYSIRYALPEITVQDAFPNQPLNTIVKTFYIKIKTIDGFEYQVKIDMTLTQPGRGNVTNINTESIYQSLIPDNLVITLDNRLDVVSLFTNEGVLFSGIYNIIICRWRKEDTQISPNVNSTCKQKSVFLDCDIYCLLVDKLVRCPDTNVFHILDALLYSNECDTLTEDKCALFETLIRKLSGPDCTDPNDDCECKDCEPRKNAYPNNFRNNLGIVKRKFKECGHCGTNRRR